MKYIVRIVAWHYDEFDTTLSAIYDVVVVAGHPDDAYEMAYKRLAPITAGYSNPGGTKLISLTDENGVIYVLSREQQLTVLPKEDYDKLPKKFCSGGETFFIVDGEEVAMRHPEPK